MLRLFIYLAGIVALAMGLSWLADRPGNLVINWEGNVVETSVFYAVVLLCAMVGAVLFIWSMLRHVWESPAALGSFLSRRREKRGLDSLSSGMIAIGAGDRSGATKYAVQARKTLPNEPLTHLLRAQAAQLSGDKATARRIYEGMLNTPDTEQLGLRGLFLEAEREGELEAARQFAERAVGLNPKLTWPIDALFELQCKAGDWEGALDTVTAARKNGHIEKASADRRRAVLLTAQAQKAEDNDPEKALTLAVEANNLAPGLVPAAAIAGRLLASRGNTPKATKIIQKTWQKAPHPDLAVAYAYSRLGDSPRDRLERVKKLAGLNPYSLESPIAVATAAVESKDYAAAREALEPLLDSRLTQRVCTLMARIEGEELGDKGRVREWLARAVNAPRDPAWTADGIVSEEWAPVSPVTGALDAFQWRVPVESAEKSETELIAKKLEELVALGAPGAAAVAAAATASDAATADSGGSASSSSAGTDAKAVVPVKSDVVDADVIEEVSSASTPAAAATKPDAPKASDIKDAMKPAAVAAVESNGSGAAASKDTERPAIKPADEPKPATTAAPTESKRVAEAEVLPGKPEAGSAPAAGQPEKKTTEKSAEKTLDNAADRLEEVAAKTKDAAHPTVAKAAGAGAVMPDASTDATDDDNGPKRSMDASIFISPPPPDDPGPDTGEPDPPLPTRPTYPLTS